MKQRSRAREVALQLLYQRDINRHIPREAIEQLAHDRLAEDSLRQFALMLYDGVLEHQGDLDQLLAEVAVNWRVSRMAVVDRNVLRIASYELLHTTETPPNVILNEGIELARRYGSADSPSFVNGILDSLRKKTKK